MRRTERFGFYLNKNPTGRGIIQDFHCCFIVVVTVVPASTLVIVEIIIINDIPIEQIFLGTLHLPCHRLIPCPYLSITCLLLFTYLLFCQLLFPSSSYY